MLQLARTETWQIWTLDGSTRWLKKAGSGLSRRLDSLGTAVEWSTQSKVQANLDNVCYPLHKSLQAREAAAAHLCVADLNGSGDPLSPQPSGFQPMAGAHHLGCLLPLSPASLSHSLFVPTIPLRTNCVTILQELCIGSPQSLWRIIAVQWSINTPITPSIHL